MAVKCILTGQTPSVLDGVTENVQTQINAKAADNAVVHLAGNETISGTKTFTGGVVMKGGAEVVGNVKATKFKGDGSELTNIPYPVTKVAGKTGAVTLAKGDVGLGNVDNTSDVNKPISNATQAALNGKQAKITASGLLKGDGAGGVTTATKGTDYVASPEVFIATYGTTTSAEIEAAYQAGKTVVCVYKDSVYYLSRRMSETKHIFSTIFPVNISASVSSFLRKIACISDVWESSGNLGFKPDKHASTHASGGSDPITPADIGAATMNEVNAAIQTAIGNAIGGSY